MLSYLINMTIVTPHSELCVHWTLLSWIFRKLLPLGYLILSPMPFKYNNIFFLVLPSIYPFLLRRLSCYSCNSIQFHSWMRLHGKGRDILIYRCGGRRGERDHYLGWFWRRRRIFLKLHLSGAAGWFSQ